MMLLYLQFRGLFLGISCAVSYWFAISLFVNAFPLVEDALNMIDKVYRKGNILQKILYTPGVWTCYAGAYLEKYCLTFVFAVALTIGILA